MVEVKYYSYLRDAIGFLKRAIEKGFQCHAVYSEGFWTLRLTLRNVAG